MEENNLHKFNEWIKIPRFDIANLQGTIYSFRTNSVIRTRIAAHEIIQILRDNDKEAFEQWFLDNKEYLQQTLNPNPVNLTISPA